MLSLVSRLCLAFGVSFIAIAAAMGINRGLTIDGWVLLLSGNLVFQIGITALKDEIRENPPCE